MATRHGYVSSLLASGKRHPLRRAILQACRCQASLMAPLLHQPGHGLVSQLCFQRPPRTCRCRLPLLGLGRPSTCHSVPFPGGPTACGGNAPAGKGVGAPAQNSALETALLFPEARHARVKARAMLIQPLPATAPAAAGGGGGGSAMPPRAGAAFAPPAFAAALAAAALPRPLAFAFGAVHFQMKRSA